MTHRTATTDVLNELIRCFFAMRRYKSCRLEGANGSVEHAAAARATMDLTRLLAQWRKKGPWDVAPRTPK